MGSGADETNAADKTSRGYIGGRERIAGIKTEDRETDTIFNDRTCNEKDKQEQAAKCPGKPPLDNNGIQALIGAFEMYGRILAIQARIEGMKVRNETDKITGNTFGQYTEKDFIQQADNIYNCVRRLQIMKHVNVV